MNRFFNTLMMLVIAAGLFITCKNDEAAPYLELYAEELTFGQNAETRYATVFASRDFTATADAAWCQVQPVAGKRGEMNNLLVIVDKNDGLDSRRTEITVTSAAGVQTITVKQAGLEPSIKAAEPNVYIDQTEDFTLEITSNILFTFELPSWIHLKAGYAPAVGTKIYAFTVDPFVEPRVGNIVMKSADVRTNYSSAVPVVQGDRDIVLVGRNKVRFEAEASTEHYPTNNVMDWWGGDSHTFVEASRWTYRVYMAENGVYDFYYLGLTWHTGVVMYMYVDGVLAGQSAMKQANEWFPTGNYAPEAEIVAYSKMQASITAGVHTILFLPDQGGQFDYFTAEYAGADVAPPDNSLPVITNSAPTEIAADKCLELYNHATNTYANWIFNGRRNIIDVHNGVFTFDVNVQDAGDYNVMLRYRRWCAPQPGCTIGTDVKLYIDDVYKGHTGELHHIDYFDKVPREDHLPQDPMLETITLPAGEHTLKFEVINPSTGTNCTNGCGDFVFGWFTVTAK